MYLKLAIRNARRSVFNYLLYITTMTILIAIMFVSNCIAIIGKVSAGFQTISLPLLITLILVILSGYINSFMLKQRAKEFANYMLLGFNRIKLLWMLFIEFWVIGLLCFVMGILIGSGLYIIFHFTIFSTFEDTKMKLIFFTQSLIQSFLYFCIVEFSTVFYIKRNIDKLQISELMIQKKINQKIGNKDRIRLWSILLGLSLLSLIILIICIVFLQFNVSYIISSFIAIPLLFSIFAFYKWFYLFIIRKRQSQSKFLYQGNRLYITAQFTSQLKTSAIMNSVLCTCLLFSTISFIVGVIMLQSVIEIFKAEIQRWMGVLQISLSIIFIVIYFSILSLQQLIEFNHQIKDIKILNYIGESKTNLKVLLKIQLLIKLSIPAIMYISLMLISIPLLNYKLNLELPIAVRHILLKSVCWFFYSYLILYLCYFTIVYVTSKRYIEHSINFKS